MENELGLILGAGAATCTQSFFIPSSLNQTDRKHNSNTIIIGCKELWLDYWLSSISLLFPSSG